LEKEFATAELIPFSLGQPFDHERELLSLDRRERFILTLERGRRRRARLKYQTRARKIVVLARLDLDGPAHRNPPDAPHRPGERLPCPHLHLYREGFGDSVAYLPEEAPGFVISDPADGLAWFMDFLNFCRVNPATVPDIQTEL
jgi:hypothetical protein